jgi:hypothetical protein
MDQTERARGLGGGAIYAALLTGAIALIVVVIGLFTNILVSAIALVAAAIAFTGIANAIFRR